MGHCAWHWLFGVPSAASYSLLVEGNELASVISQRGVNGKESSSNNVLKVLKVLGIEAARLTIIKEINETMKGHGKIDQNDL